VAESHIRRTGTEVVDSVVVATQHSQGLTNLGQAPQLQGLNALRLISILGNLGGGIAEDGGAEAETEFLASLVGYDAVLLEPRGADFLESEDQTDIVDVGPFNDETVALSAIDVLAAVELLPVDAQHGGHLDQVSDGGDGVRLLQAVGHCVPGPAFLLEADGERVRRGGGLGRFVVEEVCVLPLARLLLHALDGHQQRNPGGHLVVGGADRLARLGAALVLLHAVELGLAPRVGVLVALRRAVEVGDLLLIVAPQRPARVGFLGDEYDGHLELHLEAELIPSHASRRELGPLADHLRRT